MHFAGSAHRQLRLVVAVAAVALVGLSGCAGTATTGSSSAPTAIPEPALPTPTPSPTPVQPPLDSLVISPQGLDELRLGSPVVIDSPSTAIVAFNDDYCPAYGEVGDPGVGLWLPNYPKTSDPYDGPHAFTVRTDDRLQDGDVSELWAWSPKITTEAGIHIGSTRDEVNAAYPNPTDVVHADLSDIYVFDEGANRMVIEVIHTAGGFVTDADVDKVNLIGVMPSSREVISFVNYGIGGCGE